MNTTALWLEALAAAVAVALPRVAKTELWFWLACTARMLRRPPYNPRHMWACLRIMLYVAPWAPSKREILNALARLPLRSER